MCHWTVLTVRGLMRSGQEDVARWGGWIFFLFFVESKGVTTKKKYCRLLSHPTKWPRNSSPSFLLLTVGE